jgi:hypothetical protein
MRWLARLYPKDAFADRRSALLADIILLALGVTVVLVLALSLA